MFCYFCASMFQLIKCLKNGDLLVLYLFDVHVLSFSSISKSKQGKLNKVYMYDFTKEKKSKLISFYIVIIESGLNHLIFTAALELSV